MRCPVCKAENVQGPQCRRCKADLALLFALEGRQRQEAQAARRCLAAGHWAQALAHAAQAYWLRSDAESRRLLAVACLLNRDFSSAWYYYRAGSNGLGDGDR
jgi:predicted amidophosphoribosyltransferase